MPRARLKSLILLLALLVAAAAPPLPPQLNDPKTTEGWIWQRVQAGEVAELNERCQTLPLDIHKREDAGWQAPCRRVDPVLLRALLTQPDLADHTPHGVRINGARIDGDLDLDDAHVRAAEIWLDGSWITGDVVLVDARLDGSLSLRGSLIDGQLTGERVIIGSDLDLQNAEFDGSIDLLAAHVDGQMDMDHASVANRQSFGAVLLRVGAGGLLLRDVQFGGPVDLLDAHVDGQMDMDGARVADQQSFDAERLHVGNGGLALRNTKFGGPVLLRDAHVEDWMDMKGASVADKQTFNAQRLHVGSGGLFLIQVKFGGPVDLGNADVDGIMAMEGASVADQEPFDAIRLHVGSDLLARLVTFGGNVNFVELAIDGGLDLRDSHVRQLDLTGAVVRDDLLLGGQGHWLRWPMVSGQPACQDPAPCLNFRMRGLATCRMTSKRGRTASRWKVSRIRISAALAESSGRTCVTAQSTGGATG